MSLIQALAQARAAFFVPNFDLYISKAISAITKHRIPQQSNDSSKRNVEYRVGWTSLHPSFSAMDWISSLSSQGSSANVWTATAVVTCLALFQLFRYKQQQRFRREYGEADHELPFSTISIWGLTIGPGIEYHWKERFKLYKNNEKELLVLRPKVFGDPYFFTNSPEVLRQVNGQGWDKPEW
ncbi:hypothetical protein FRC19_002837 [Serendipita sp. 401]|nr:hypothetical protein FRC19_002837 [Serendipita sp. 401]